jgi:hypothetical protein
MVNQKAAVCNYQTASMGRIACTSVGGVAMNDKLGHLSGVDWAMQNWVLSARDAPLRERRARRGREAFSG